VGDLNKTCSGWNSTRLGSLDPELIPSYSGTDDIDDRIDCSDLMKVNLVDRYSMNICFGFGEPLEDPASDTSSSWAKPCSGDETKDLIQIPMKWICRCGDMEFYRSEASFANRGNR
jgi:hypothetical protein